MRRLIRDILKPHYGFFLCLFVAATTFLYVTQPFDVAITHDGAAYIDGAFQFLNHQEYTHDHWPPGYSYLLFLSSKVLFSNPIMAAKWLNLVLLFVGIAFMYRLMSYLHSDRYIQWLGVVLFCCLEPWVESSYRIASELPAIVLTLVLFCG